MNSTEWIERGCVCIDRRERGISLSIGAIQSTDLSKKEDPWNNFSTQAAPERMATSSTSRTCRSLTAWNNGKGR